MAEQQYSERVRSLLTAMESGAMTMQDLAEAFTALNDEQIEGLVRLLRERHGPRLIPRKTLH